MSALPLKELAEQGVGNEGSRRAARAPVPPPRLCGSPPDPYGGWHKATSEGASKSARHCLNPQSMAPDRHLDQPKPAPAVARTTSVQEGDERLRLAWVLATPASRQEMTSRWASVAKEADREGGCRTGTRMPVLETGGAAVAHCFEHL